jgi:hypothetical protein
VPFSKELETFKGWSEKRFTLVTPIEGDSIKKYNGEYKMIAPNLEVGS